MEKSRKNSGFTLLEVQIAIALMVFAVGGLGVAMLNRQKQVRWLETKDQLFTTVTASNTFISAEVTSAQIPSPLLNYVSVVDMKKTKTNHLVAEVAVTAK